MQINQRSTLTIAALLIASFTSTGWAQPTRLAAPGMNVALLDLGYIFKNHPRFKQKMEMMKQDVQAFEEQVKQQQRQLEAAGRRLGTYKPGSLEYKNIEETTTKQLADLRVQIQLKRKDIIEREAQIYMETYKEVIHSVATFASQRKIDLVLRYDSDTGPLTGVVNPRETMKVINRPVIFQYQLDITKLILNELSRPSTARGPAASQR